MKLALFGFAGLILVVLVALPIFEHWKMTRRYHRR
jgi:hypothetical protein